MALVITTLTTSMTGTTWYLMPFLSYWHHVAFNVICVILTPSGI